MITSILFETIIQAKISAGSKSEFAEDLAEIKSVAPADREFDEEKKLWTIRNPQNYRHLSFVERAYETRKRQPTLF